MGEIIRLPRKRNETVRGVARQLVTEATKHVKEPSAVVIIAINAESGDYALRMTNDQSIKPIDAYGRAMALITHAQSGLLDVFD